jgi:hypothetical protein
MTEFESKVDVDSVDTEVFIRIPHSSWKRVISVFLAGVTFVLGAIGVPGSVSKLLPKGHNTEVQK